MLESNLSVIASSVTILGFFINILIKQHSINNNQKIEGNNNAINNQQSVTIYENNTYNDIKSLRNLRNSENELSNVAFLFVALLVSITIFIKFNHLIITISCLYTLFTSFLIWIKLKKYHLSMKSFLFYAIKYILISSILITGLFYNPVLVSNLEKALPIIDKTNFTSFMSSIITMSKSTFLYFKNLGFPSYDTFVIIFRFLSLFIIFCTLYHDIKKESFLKATSQLYLSGNRLLLSYICLIFNIILVLYFMHFHYFENITRDILNPILDWFDIPYK